MSAEELIDKIKRYEPNRIIKDVELFEQLLGMDGDNLERVYDFTENDKHVHPMVRNFVDQIYKKNFSESEKGR